MHPSEFFFTLQKGITGGFAPPIPTAVYTVTASPKVPHIYVTSGTRNDGTPSLQDASPKTLASDDAETTALVGELHGILKTLPTEDPGCEDLYGMDTSIFWGSEDLQWKNGASGGCGSTKSKKEATDEEKKKFGRAVEIVHKLVSKAA